MHITPQTKVGELLDHYPDLEKILFEISPSFAKLKNPVLRKTVARVASLQQAAIVAGIKVEDMVNRLRKEVGQGEFSTEGNSEALIEEEFPSWFQEQNIAIRYNAIPIINSGESPMTEILRQTKDLNKSQIFELKTPFIPAPIIEILRNQGFESFSIKQNNEILSYFIKK